MQIVIAAAGKGTRLYSESLEVNKPLFYYQSKPIIAHLIDLYKKYSDDINVIVSNNKLGEFTKNWLLDYYKSPRWLKIVTQEKPVGTNNAIANIELKDNVLISWSDFIIDETEFKNLYYKEFYEDTFITSNINCRFGLTDGKITQTNSNPGFIGLYYFNKKPILDLEKEDFIENFIGKSVKTKNLNVLNLGEIKELVENKAFDKKSNRYFNEIIFTDQNVIKKPITNHGKILQDKEINWYKNSPEELKEHLPKFRHENDSLILERIIGKPASSFNFGKQFWRKDLPDLLNKLHKAKIAVNKEDCNSTYIEKPIQRLKEVENVIKSWFSNSMKINEFDFSDWKFPDPPKDLIPKEFYFIHGDLQFSNLFVREDGKLILLDPRGHFGNTLLYGDPAYDIAKILYAIDGYHKINEGKFSINKCNDGSTFLIHNQLYEINEDIKFFFDWACDKYEISKEKLNYLLFTIWISLTSYIIDQPLGVIAAYSKALLRSKQPLL